MKKEANYCANCGQKTIVDIKAKGKKESKKKTQRVKIIIGILVLIFAICGILLFAFNMHKRQDSIKNAIQSEFMTVLGYHEDHANPVIETIAHGLKIEIKKIHINENNNYEVLCTLSNYNVVDAVSRLNSDADNVSLRDYYDMLGDEIMASERIEFETTLTIQKNDNNKVVFTQEQFNYASGGILELYKITLMEEVK